MPSTSDAAATDRHPSAPPTAVADPPTADLPRAPSRPARRRGRRVLRVIVVLLAVVLVVLPALLLISAGIARAVLAAQTRIDAPGGIEEQVSITVGGVEQEVLMRGADATAPILFFVHGGPGTPAMPEAHVRDERLVEDFVVVHWDQRGAGRSFGGVDAASVTSEQLVSDAAEVLTYARERLDTDEVYLVGHSWGSLLGAQIAAAHPDLITAYVGIGQAVGAPSFEVSRDVLIAEATRRGDTGRLEKLNAMPAQPWGFAEYQLIGTANSSYGLLVTGSPNPLETPWNVLRSPAYTPFDIISYYRGQLFSVQAAIDSNMIVEDLNESTPAIDVPVWVVAGEFDNATPAEAAREWFDALDAPGKTWVDQPGVAHFGMWEDPEAFATIMSGVVTATRQG